MSPLFKKNKETEKGVKDKKPDDKSQAIKPSEDALRPPAPDGDKPAPLLNDEDEKFLERLVSTSDDGHGEEEGPPPPLPPRPTTPVLTWDSDSESSRLPDKEEPGASTMTATKKPNRFSRLFHRSKPSSSNALTVPNSTVPPEEADREWADLNRFLSRLDLQPTTDSPDATSKKAKAKAAALTASAEVQSLLRQFLLVLKDITNGAPTAVDDLVALLDGRNDALKRGFDKLPSSMQKLVTQLPKKLTGALGPEILAAAAEAQGLKGKRETDAGFTKFFLPRNLGDLVMTPAVVQSMLKAIVNALKVRWPAFAGTSVLWSSAVFLLLFVLWYCHKRGREEREKLEEAGRMGDVEEAADAEVTGERAEEAGSSAVVVVESPAESPRS